MMGILALCCCVTGFIAAWLLRTRYVMTQISWAQQEMERKVRYWQGKATHARGVAEHLLRQPEASTGRPPEPTDWPGQEHELPTAAAELILAVVPIGRYAARLSGRASGLALAVRPADGADVSGVKGGSLRPSPWRRDRRDPP